MSQWKGGISDLASFSWPFKVLIFQILTMKVCFKITFKAFKNRLFLPPPSFFIGGFTLFQVGGKKRLLLLDHALEILLCAWIRKQELQQWESSSSKVGKKCCIFHLNSCVPNVF